MKNWGRRGCDGMVVGLTRCTQHINSSSADVWSHSQSFDFVVTKFWEFFFF